MKSSELFHVVVKVAESLRNGTEAALDDAVIEAAGGLEAYVKEKALAGLATDQAAAARAMRDAQTLQAARSQITLPGLEHAALPSSVEIKEEGRRIFVPLAMATIDQTDAEVRRMERATAVRVRVTEGYRATVNRVKELVGDGSTLMGDVMAMFPADELV